MLLFQFNGMLTPTRFSPKMLECVSQFSSDSLLVIPLYYKGDLIIITEASCPTYSGSLALNWLAY